MKFKIEYWKIKRELFRFKNQLFGFVSEFYEPFIRFHYDKILYRKINHMSGKVQLKNKIAILLIYQHNQISFYIFNLLRHLCDNNYSVLLISNSLISEIDKLKASNYFWKLIERKNFGYDFGGYRDGLRFLNDLNVNPEKLIIINDSIIFPIYEPDTLIKEMESVNYDLIGVKNFVYRKHSGIYKNGFLGSYFYLINNNAYNHPAFKKFWKNYKNTNNKYKVLKRGENIFSINMIKYGLTTHAINTKDDFISKLNNQTNIFILKTLKYAAYIYEADSERSIALINKYDESDYWKFTALNHIYVTISHSHYEAAFVYAAIKLQNSRYLKKNNDILFIQARKNFLKAIEDGELDSPITEILNDIKNYTLI